jgi:hypothetical protein
MKGYMTKYALTDGIREVEVRPPRDDNGKYVYTTDTQWPTQLRVGKDFFPDRDSAEARAKQMARQKIASLERQIKRLKPLTRNVKWME